MAGTPLCDEMIRLIREFSDAARDYAVKLGDLNRYLMGAADADLDLLRRIVEDARIRAEQARAALAQHRTEHGC